MKMWKKVIIGFVAVMALVLTLGLVFGMKGMKEVREYQIPQIDLSAVADGEYMGDYTNGRWGLSVKVIIRDHVVTDIQIVDKKKSNVSKSLADKINKKIFESKSVNVDAESGATVSSKAYLIAISKALQKN
ncbi:MAG: FMN-binding protein [Fibrobacteres bacterium]|nr:FMN-binding protein [Fibrobacterota bacterium]